MLTSMFAQIMASWPPPSPKILMLTQIMTSGHFKATNHILYCDILYKIIINGIIPDIPPSPNVMTDPVIDFPTFGNKKL